MYHLGTAKYKQPIVKLKDDVSGKYLTANGVNEEVTLQAEANDDSQKW